jgi:epsilon-lactone hydrolase
LKKGGKQMNLSRLPTILSLILMAALAEPSLAQTAASQADPAAAFTTLEAAQNAANAQKGPRTVPERSIPVPGTVSPELQTVIAAPYRVPQWDANPKNATEWKELVATVAARIAAAQVGVREKLGVTMQPAVIGGVKAFSLTPKVIPPAHRNQLLVHVHGGGYVFGPGESGTGEAALMAAYGGYR